MLMVSLQGTDYVAFGKVSLLRLKTRAMRSGVWFKALQRIDRVLVELTIKVACAVHSVILVQRILAVTSKLQTFFETQFSRAIKLVGFPKACELCGFAQKWGNEKAKAWTKDSSFARYLVIMQLFSRHASGVK